MFFLRSLKTIYIYECQKTSLLYLHIFVKYIVATGKNYITFVCMSG